MNEVLFLIMLETNMLELKKNFHFVPRDEPAGITRTRVYCRIALVTPLLKINGPDSRRTSGSAK